MAFDRSPRALRFLSWTVPLAALAAFGAVPLAWMVLQAVRAGVESEALFEPSLWRLLGRSVSLSLCVAFLTSLLGTTAGCLLAATTWRGKTLWRAVLVLPLAIPPYLHAIGWTTLLQPRGTAASLASSLLAISPSMISEALYSFWGAAVVLSLAYFPVVMLFCERSLALSSPALVEAARVFGAGSWKAFVAARWPFLKPSVASSAMIVFLLASSDLGVPTILNVPVFNFEVFTQLGAFNDVTAATLLTVPLLAVGFLALTLERSITLGNLYEVNAGDVEVPRSATRNEVRFNSLFFVTLAAIVLALPFGAVIIQALDNEALSKMFQLATRPAANTFQYASIASLLITLIAFSLAWSMRRASPSLLRRVDWLLIVGFAVPSTVLALALLSLYDRPNIAQWISPATLVVAALVVRYSIIGFRIASATIGQFPSALFEAAALDGASPVRVAWHILLPMAYISVLATLTLAFVLSVGEIGSTILLHPPGGETLPIALYAIEANSPRSYVAAMTLYQLLLSFCPLALIMTILVRHGRTQASPGEGLTSERSR